MKLECTVEEWKELMKKESQGNETLDAEKFKEFLEKPGAMEMIKSATSSNGFFSRP